MTIINSQLGGKKPTGTINISQNGIVDVTDFATADVQVPTTAPDFYMEFTKDANNTLQVPTTLMNLSGIKDLGNNVLAYKYYNNTNITSVDMSGLEKITGTNALFNAFYGCTNIISVDMSNIKTITGSCQAAFYNITNLTSVNISSLESVDNVNGCSQMFYGTGITSIDLSNLKYLNAQSAFYQIFQNTKLTSLSLPKLEIVSSATVMDSAFRGITTLTTASMPKLCVANGQRALQNIFFGDTALTSFSFDSLATTKGTEVLRYAFQNTGITSISFPKFSKATIISGANALATMLNGITGCTVHFPSNLDPQGGDTTISSLTGYPNFGGTDTVLLFDLPAVDKIDWSAITEIDGNGTLQSIYANNGSTASMALDLSNLKKISGTSSFAYAFGNSKITSVNLSSLEVIGTNSSSGAFQNITTLTSVNLSSLKDVESSNNSWFSNDTALASIDLSSIETLSGSLNSWFSGCTSLASVNLSGLKNITGSYAFNGAFSGTAITSLSFPSLMTITQTDGLAQMMTGCSNVILHFPSNMQSVVEGQSGYLGGFSGTNITILFDLPAIS